VPGHLLEDAVAHPVLQDAIRHAASVSLTPGEQPKLRRRDREQAIHNFLLGRGEAPAHGTSTVRH